MSLLHLCGSVQGEQGGALGVLADAAGWGLTRTCGNGWWLFRYFKTCDGIYGTLVGSVMVKMGVEKHLAVCFNEFLLSVLYIVCHRMTTRNTFHQLRGLYHWSTLLSVEIDLEAPHKC
jgi:hypothetical protein